MYSDEVIIKEVVNDEIMQDFFLWFLKNAHFLYLFVYSQLIYHAHSHTHTHLEDNFFCEMKPISLTYSL